LAAKQGFDICSFGVKWFRYVYDSEGLVRELYDATNRDWRLFNDGMLNNGQFQYRAARQMYLIWNRAIWHAE
jgi:hypothetical protein